MPAPRPISGAAFRLCLGALAITATASPAAASPDCEVSRIEGDEARLWQEGVWLPLRTGRLAAGEPKIVTGEATRIEITCSDGSVLAIGPETEVNLESLLDGAESTRSVVVQLIEGLIGMVAPGRNDGRFELRSPLAVASVRSTEWLMQHGETGTAVFVREGNVAVSWAGGSARLKAGDGIDIAPGPATEGPKQWGQARVDRVTAALGFGWR